MYRPANISAIFVNIFTFNSRLLTCFRRLIDKFQKQSTEASSNMNFFI